MRSFYLLQAATHSTGVPLVPVPTASTTHARIEGKPSQATRNQREPFSLHQSIANLTDRRPIKSAASVTRSGSRSLSTPFWLGDAGWWSCGGGVCATCSRSRPFYFVGQRGAMRRVRYPGRRWFRGTQRRPRNDAETDRAAAAHRLFLSPSLPSRAYAVA